LIFFHFATIYEHHPILLHCRVVKTNVTHPICIGCHVSVCPHMSIASIKIVATLALGSQPRQGFAKVRAKYEAWESHFMFPGVQKSVREWTLTLPSELSIWELDSRWTPESSESDCRGQNHLDSKVPYIIENFLKHRCLKWACMTHLET
jgi:hypothetical protein